MSTQLTLIEKFIESDTPVLCWGAPGVGKTAAITELANKHNAHLEVVIGSTIDPTDLGRPVVNDEGEVDTKSPAWARRLRDAIKDKKEAWLFLDELTCAPPAMQAGLLRVVQERQVADTDLSGVRLIGAANPPEQGVDVTELTAATANRWAHITWSPDTKEWCAGELAGWGKPDKKLAAYRALVAGWIDNSPGALVDPPSANQETIRGWPSPRSWSAVARILTALNTTMGPDVKQAVSGLVGEGAATEFLTWIRDTDLPTPQDLLDGKAKVPSRGDKQMLCMSSAISYAIANDRLTDLWSLCMSVAKRKDIALRAAKRALSAAERANLDINKSHTKDLQALIDLKRNKTF